MEERASEQMRKQADAMTKISCLSPVPISCTSCSVSFRDSLVKRLKRQHPTQPLGTQLERLRIHRIDVHGDVYPGVDVEQEGFVDAGCLRGGGAAER